MPCFASLRASGFLRPHRSIMRGKKDAPFALERTDSNSSGSDGYDCLSSSPVSCALNPEKKHATPPLAPPDVGDKFAGREHRLYARREAAFSVSALRDSKKISQPLPASSSSFIFVASGSASPITGVTLKVLISGCTLNRRTAIHNDVVDNTLRANAIRAGFRHRWQLQNSPRTNGGTAHSVST